MRTSPTLKMTTIESSTTTTTSAAATKETLTPPVTIPRSPWHSPVPYVFGGLAAMLGLIAFALLMLACSYWKLSGHVNGGDDGADRDVEGGDAAEKCDHTSDTKASPAFEEKFLVIMAGEVMPTFLATPMKASSSKDERLDSEEKEIKEENEKQTSQESQVGQEQIPT